MIEKKLVKEEEEYMLAFKDSIYGIPKFEEEEAIREALKRFLTTIIAE